MTNNGKLESLITIPSGGYGATVTDADGGPTAATLLTADKTYYWSVAGNDTVDLPARLAVTLEAANGGGSAGWAVTVDATEGGTGKCTISVSTGTFTLVWTDTELRDLLGFDGTEDVTAVSSATGNDQVHGLWLPDCPPRTPFSVDDEGWDESDAVSTIAPTGTVVSTVYNTRTATALEWQMVSKARARTADESTTNESFQTFYTQSLWGLKEWAKPGGPINYHPDADTDGTYTNYGVVLDREVKPEQVTQGYDAWYSVQLRRLVKVP